MVVTAIVLAGILMAYVVTTGLDARAEPGPWETRLARSVRRLAVPGAIRDRRNPVSLSPEVLEDALAHFADHCASCHASDGSGNTEQGRGLFPKAPDMRLAATQTLTDGELFYIIEHGVRFTGMPGWSTGTAAGETATWQLIHVIRRLPMLTPDELNTIEQHRPRSPADVRQEIEEEQFLRGEPDTQTPPSATSSHSGEHK
jgi:mono/diheme cytochrome c family protein